MVSLHNATNSNQDTKITTSTHFDRERLNMETELCSTSHRGVPTLQYDVHVYDTRSARSETFTGIIQTSKDQGIF